MDLTDSVHKVWPDHSDVLTIVITEKGKLSHAKEAGDMILHEQGGRERQTLWAPAICLSARGL